nr:AAA family ATPase [uncultured Gellertiella sp.]
MLTKFKARNFKRFEEFEVELGDVVVFIGPNNGGKSSALQALLLWNAGLQIWTSERKKNAEKRPGVTIPRLGLTQVPVSDAKHLWQKLRVRNVSRNEAGKQHTENILIETTAWGETGGKPWSCGLEFDYANPESFYCRPLATADGAGRMPVPEEAKSERINLLPPLSGILTDEPELQSGRVNVLLGEGRSGEVLRNLCLAAWQNGEESWDRVTKGVRAIFGVKMHKPQRDPARGIINLTYSENGVEFPLTSAGSGLKQVLLLLSYMEGNPGSTLLLDEPDAHLEVLKQRQVYGVLADIAQRSGSQIIIASHSEVVMQEAMDRDVLIGFLGLPRRIDDRGASSQIAKSLKDIRADDYYQAERKGYVLYLEGSTDLQFLRSFAKLLNHPAQEILSEPFVHYVANQPTSAQAHFFGLKHACPRLKAFALFDRLHRPLPDGFDIKHHIWSKREIENYLPLPDVLFRYADSGNKDDLLERAQIDQNIAAMKSSIEEVEGASKILRQDPWGDDTKVSDHTLDNIFINYFERLGRSNRMQKTDYHVLVGFAKRSEISPEVVTALDELVEALR